MPFSSQKSTTSGDNRDSMNKTEDETRQNDPVVQNLERIQASNNPNTSQQEAYNTHNPATQPPFGAEESNAIVIHNNSNSNAIVIHNNNHNIRNVPKMPEGVHPRKMEMKNDRKAKMAGCATTGAIVGAMLTGPVWPVGAIAGAAIGSYAGKVTSRAGERRQQRKWEQNYFNDYLSKGKAGVQSESVVFA